MVRAVIFDLDDTLYDYSFLHMKALKALEDYTCVHYGVTAAQFQSAFSTARAETKKTLNNTGASHNRMLYCQKTLENLGLSPADGALEMYETYWTYILEHMILREGAAELLEICGDRGIKIGVCSDLTAHIQHRKLRALGIASQIDALVTSEEVGVEKPDPRMFALILKKLRCGPEQALFVGDSLMRDIQGAEKAGLRALWLGGVDRENAITSLKEVEALIL